jgi:hypothetical protein
MTAFPQRKWNYVTEKLDSEHWTGCPTLSKQERSRFSERQLNETKAVFKVYVCKKNGRTESPSRCLTISVRIENINCINGRAIE